MACITSLEQNTQNGTWAGLSLKNGEKKTFKTLGDYEQYLKSLEASGTYCPRPEPVYNIPYTKPVENHPPTGFLQFAPRDPVKQAKYSAMSPVWEGVASSEAAVARGDYSLDSAETTRRELRAQYTPSTRPMIPAVSQTCVIQ